MQRNDIISGRWPARLIVLLLGVPSLGFAIVSGLFNASYAARLGHEQHEQAAWIAASVLITSFVTGLPLAIEVLRARVPHLAAAARALWLASLMFSFVAAMGYAAATRGQATAEADALLKDRAGLERAIARSEAELAALPPHRPAGAVQAELRAIEVRTGMNCRNPRRQWVRKACAPVLALRAELAAAEDAARIEAHLLHLRAQLSGRVITGTNANPQADVLAWLAGGMVSAEMWERLLTVFAAALIELSAALGLAITARSVMELRAPCEVQPVPATQPEPARPIMPETVTMPVPTPEQGWQTWFRRCVTPRSGRTCLCKGRLRPLRDMGERQCQRRHPPIPHLRAAHVGSGRSHRRKGREIEQPFLCRCHAGRVWRRRSREDAWEAELKRRWCGWELFAIIPAIFPQAEYFRPPHR